MPINDDWRMGKICGDGELEIISEGKRDQQSKDDKPAAKKIFGISSRNGFAFGLNIILNGEKKRSMRSVIHCMMLDAFDDIVTPPDNNYPRIRT